MATTPGQTTHEKARAPRSDESNTTDEDTRDSARSDDENATDDDTQDRARLACARARALLTLTPT
jgi:hypothetical protein